MSLIKGSQERPKVMLPRIEILFRDLMNLSSRRIIHDVGWKVEIRCRLGLILYDICDIISKGKHFWREYEHPSMGLGIKCKFCKSFSITKKERAKYMGEAVLASSSKSINSKGSS